MRKTLILCPLAILTFAAIGRQAQANPRFVPLDAGAPASPQWSDAPGASRTPPQWNDAADVSPSSTFQWSAPPPVSPTVVVPASEPIPTLAPPVEAQADDVPAPLTSPEAAPADAEEVPESPLATGQFQQPTAQTLRQGEVVINGYSRLFPEGGEDEETAINFGTGFTWGVTDNLDLSLEFQHVDSGSPGRQGDFNAIRTADNDGTLEAKYKLWQISENQALSGVFALSFGTREVTFSRNGEVDEVRDTGLVPGIQIPYTATINERLQLTVAPSIAFFSEENALFLARLPGDDGEFGTTFGVTGAVSYQLNQRLALWGDAFIPITGNNSIDRDSGEVERAIAYNAGFRYRVNPRVALDVFASNALGSKGPLALTADQEFTAIGANVVFMPDFIGANRRYGSDFELQNQEDTAPITTDGLAYLDGGTIPSGRFLLTLQGGSQGVLTSLRYGVVKDLEAGIYLDYISSDVDESEQGLSGKVRLLNQAEGDPLTVSLAATLGIVNQPIVNFANNDRDEFDRRDLDNEVPFLLQGDETDESRLYVVTLSLPLNYQLNSGLAFWFTPTIGYLQQNGAEIAGFNVGGSVPVFEQFAFVGEVGINFADEGNAFIGDRRDNAIPWTVAVRWNPSRFFGADPETMTNSALVELYLTNRVGFSTWHNLRVRDQNDTAIGVGVSLPF
ncbi:MAG: hypothetical protein ACFB4I_07115 [Cyanophyceae cyanobacterium]